MRIDVNNVSHATLKRIAPLVESLANRNLRELPRPDVNRLSEEDRALGEIRRAVGAYMPQERHNPRGTMMAPIPQISAMRRARHEAGLFANAAPGQRVGMGAFNPATGEVRSFSSVEEFRSFMFQAQRDSDQNMINQLMGAINTLRAANPHLPTVGIGLDITT